MKILIIDIETTGFLPKGRIVEVGVVELCLKTGEKNIIFDKVINPCLNEKVINSSWIVKNGYMTTEMIIQSKSFSDIAVELQDIILSYPDGLTAFNRKFDIDFLESYGIVFPRKLPCPMLLSTSICKLPNKNGYRGYKWPKVEEAYKYFYPKSDYIELHRGADDAFHEADIVLALHKLNKFI